MKIGKEFIIMAALAIIAIACIVCREYEHKRRISALNVDIANLSETIREQDGQIASLGAQLKAARTEADALKSYAARVEEIQEAGNGAKKNIIETMQIDAESRAWCDIPVPAAIRDILYKSCGSGKD